MEFTLAGEQFDVTHELGRGCMAGAVPDAIDQYWVEIDRTRWSVKQVMALATGLSRGKFRSLNSRRLLAKLGFLVDVGASAIEGIVRPVTAPRAARTVDVSRLPELETVSATVSLTWRAAGQVVLDNDSLPRFPPLPALPGLYRYDFGTDADGMRVLYFGESQDLARRARNYRGAKTDRSTQKTSRRIHTEIVGQLILGGTIDFAVATEVSVDEGGAADLRLKSARRLAENAVVLLAQQAPATRVLNIDAELPQPDDGA